MILRSAGFALLLVLVVTTAVEASYKTIKTGTSGLGSARKKIALYGPPRALSATFRVKYEGTHSILIELRDSKGEVVKVIAKKKGPIKPTTYVSCRIPRAGYYEIRVKAYDDKKWSVVISQYVRTHR